MLVHPATYLAKNGIPQSNSLSDRHRTLLDLARNANTSNKESHAHTFQGDVRRDGKIPCMGIHTLKDGLWTKLDFRKSIKKSEKSASMWSLQLNMPS